MALPLLLGVGTGVAVGYVVFNKNAMLPAINVTPPSVPVNQTYTMTLTGFPPNTPLVSPMDLSGSSLVSLGTTDANGNLTLTGVHAYGPAGYYFLIAWDAPTGRYCARYTLQVT